MSDQPNVLSEFATAAFPAGLALRFRTVQVLDATGRTIQPRHGPELEFQVSAEQATELAHEILAAVKDWKSKHQH